MLPRRKLPSLNSLRAFEVAGRCLSFQKAAEELGVTQGAIAQQVRTLEEHLGVVLFQRLPRGLSLTPKGAVYLADMSRAFDLMGEATSTAMSQSNQVTISVTPTFAAKMLIPRLGELNALFPDIELKTIATEVISNFDSDQIDIAVRLSDGPFPKNLHVESLFAQELIVVASPLLGISSEASFSLEELMAFPLLHDAHNYWAKVLQSNQSLSGAKFNQTALVIDAALAGQGVALVCRAFVENDLALGRLFQIVKDSYFIKPSFALVKKKTEQTSKSVNQVWQWCLQEFQC